MAFNFVLITRGCKLRRPAAPVFRGQQIIPMKANENALPPDWGRVLEPETTASYFRTLQAFVAAERSAHEVFPPADEVFNAFRLSSFAGTRVLLLGQDPYHDAGQAHGLCFSVRDGQRFPPSLRNVFKELAADIGCPTPRSGDLSGWARQGVLLLNTVLTVRAHQPNSHKNRGWERFTDAVIAALAGRDVPMVFVLWGNHAKQKQRLITSPKHRVLISAHPSPLSAHNGFLGSKPFSGINTALQGLGHKPIDWCLP